MSRRDYPVADRYEERESEYYRRPRRDREHDDFEIDFSREREPRRADTVVKERERDSVVSSRRGPRQPDFLREDYGKSNTAGPMVLREDRQEEDVYSRPARRRSPEAGRPRAPPEHIEEDTYVFRETERSDRGPPYPRSQRSEVDAREKDKEEVIYRERTRSRPPPRDGGSEEKIDIRISRDELDSRPPQPRSEEPIEEIRFRRGGGDRPSPPRTTIEETKIDIRERDRSAAPPARTRIEREEIDIRERRSPAPPRSEVDKEEIVYRERRSPPNRGRAVLEEEIDILERSGPPPRQRSQSRGHLVARKEEEWVVRRPRTPPPRDYEKEEIIIRRQKERTPSPEPEPPREPTPEPFPPPPEPIYRPPIIQEVITHHRHIDHGFERARSPTPPPAPSIPSPPRETKEENFEIEIRRRGMRNGKAYEDDFTFETETHERNDRAATRRRSISVDRQRTTSVSARRRSPSPAGPPARRRYDDELASEADYYNRKISSRAYPGEAYNGATRDWALVDVPPGTERVRMDGIGGGAQEITWQRYNGERRGKFISGDRVYEQEYGNGYSSPPPVQLAIPPPAPAPPRDSKTETKEEIRITHKHSSGGNESKQRKRDKMWTEVTKDLVIKEAIEEMGYEWEESDDHFYVMEYLRYEDVLKLVEVTEEIKRERRERIREIQWEREESDRGQKMLPPPPPKSVYDEKIYEREVIYDRDGRRHRR